MPSNPAVFFQPTIIDSIERKPLFELRPEWRPQFMDQNNEAWGLVFDRMSDGDGEFWWSNGLVSTLGEVIDVMTASALIRASLCDAAIAAYTTATVRNPILNDITPRQYVIASLAMEVLFAPTDESRNEHAHRLHLALEGAES